MKIETEHLEDHQIELTVEFEDELVDGVKRRAARKIARRVKVPGFRPGKAPYPIIVRQVGEAAVLEEALDILIDDMYPKIIDETEISPYGPGSLEEVVGVDPLILKFLVPLQAEVELNDYRSIRRPYEPEPVKDEAVDEVLENLRERQAVIEPVERPVEASDLVTIRLNAQNMHPEEDQDPVLIQERSMPILVKTKEAADDSESEWPFPGFSSELVALSADDEKSLTYTFAEDAEQEAFRGKEIKFHLVVEGVKARTLPALDDEFAASVGEFADFSTLREEILNSLENQAQQAYNDEYDQLITDEAIEQATIVYPPQMLETEIKSMLTDLERRLKQQNLDMDLYLKTRNMEMNDLREEVKPAAEKRLKQSLFLYEVANVEGVEIDPQELQTETQNTIEMLTRTMSEQETRQLQDQQVLSNIARSIMADLLLQRSMERFRNICSGKLEEELSQEELSEEVDAEAETIVTAEDEDLTPEEQDQDVEKEQTVDSEEDKSAADENLDSEEVELDGDEITPEDVESSSEEEE